MLSAVYTAEDHIIDVAVGTDSVHQDDDLRIKKLLQAFEQSKRSFEKITDFLNPNESQK